MSTPTEYQRILDVLNTTEANLAHERTAHAELRAAIEAWLGDMESMRDAGSFKLLDHENLTVLLNASLDSLRALFADDGAAALREHDEKVRRDVLRGEAAWLREAASNAPGKGYTSQQVEGFGWAVAWVESHAERGTAGDQPIQGDDAQSWGYDGDG